jgi:cathepsin L
MTRFVALALISFAGPCESAKVFLRSTKTQGDTESYTFKQFIQDFGRSYTAGTAEYAQRSALFETSLDKIIAVNSKSDHQKGSWTAGIHAFMDWTTQEKKAIQGYKPSPAKRARVTGLFQASAKGSTSSRMNLSAAVVYEDEYLGEGAQHRSQGQCGSCWAISAAEAVEAQLRRSGHREQVSAQALVDCVPNPQHCGGTGGCDGATGELAFAFMQKHGIPLESDLPYRKSSSIVGDPQDGAVCKMDPNAEFYPTTRRVTVDGWESKPSNKAAGLYQALNEQGSAVVAVDANDWFEYQSGVFDGCSKNAELVHAVLAKGYGRDKQTGKKFWLIQNSWSTGWGENGDIRILRHDSDDEWCGTDSHPEKGLGCDDGPPQVDVCGMCGILYDPLVPTGVRIVDDKEVGSAARATKGDYTPWRPR